MLFRKYGWRAIEVFNRAWINIVKGGIADITRSSSFDEKIYKVIAKLKNRLYFLKVHCLQLLPKKIF
ncbi:MAG: hypothetical protein B6U75_03790 [Desulfurococcales archaeon ex4484_217_1]|nr:MAG: hypothetical protein B6U75_03790 [Desulfurococcales archaeon ex4484_217_1]